MKEVAEAWRLAHSWVRRSVLETELMLESSMVWGREDLLASCSAANSAVLKVDLMEAGSAWVSALWSEAVRGPMKASTRAKMTGDWWEFSMEAVPDKQ